MQSIFVDSNVFGNMMHGFDWAVWVTVAINAFGGLVVAVVIKFADNILKVGLELKARGRGERVI